MMQMPMTTTGAQGGRMVEVSGVALPLKSCSLRVDARGGLSRVTFVQRFENPHREPLSVTYKLPLPADAAVSGFSFVVGDRTIRGVVEGRQEARERFERAILDGKSAALLEQDRSSLFTQEIGNIPPGAAVEAHIELDQRLAWLSEGFWEWRFPLAAAPRYLGGGSEGDVTLSVANRDLGARASLDMAIRDALKEGRSPESPSHPLVCSLGVDAFDVELGSGNRVELDRDVVVRWPAAARSPGATLDVARSASGKLSGSSYALLTIVPPEPSAGVASVSRDLIVLLDTSGSMSGEPLDQAKRVACALVDALGPTDQIELIEFSNAARSFRSRPEPASQAMKKAALKWIQGLRASGGTEMLSGVNRALRELRPGAQRQIVLITDGLVGFEREIVSTLLRELPTTARLHALGVGSAVNRSLLAPIARAGRGVEAIIGLGEDPERAAKRLLAHTDAPVVVDLVVEGAGLRRVVPSRLGDVFAGSPLRVAMEVAPEGGEILVRGRMASGTFEHRARFEALDLGQGSEAVVKLFARELVEELEMQLSAGDEPASRERELERTGTMFQISTRLTSWIAVGEDVTVDPRDPSRHVEQPQALPYGMSASGLGLRSELDWGGMHVNRTSNVSPRGRMAAPFAMAPVHYPMGAPAAASPGSGYRDTGPLAMAPHYPMGAPAADPPGLGRRDTGRFDDALSRTPPPSGSSPLPPAPSAPSPAAPKRSPSLFERAKQSLADVFAGGARKSGATRQEPTSQLLGASPSDSSQAIEARIVGVDGDLVRVQLIAPKEGLELSFDGMKVTATAPDGRQSSAIVVVEQSTRGGEHAAGLIVRIVVRLSQGSPRPSAVHIELPSGVMIHAR